MVDSPEPDSVNVLQFREQVSQHLVSWVGQLLASRASHMHIHVIQAHADSNYAQLYGLSRA